MSRGETERAASPGLSSSSSRAVDASAGAQPQDPVTSYPPPRGSKCPTQGLWGAHSRQASNAALCASPPVAPSLPGHRSCSPFFHLSFRPVTQAPWRKRHPQSFSTETKDLHPGEVAESNTNRKRWVARLWVLTSRARHEGGGHLGVNLLFVIEGVWVEAEQLFDRHLGETIGPRAHGCLLGSTWNQRHPAAHCARVSAPPPCGKLSCSLWPAGPCSPCTRRVAPEGTLTRCLLSWSSKGPRHGTIHLQKGFQQAEREGKV